MADPRGEAGSVVRPYLVTGGRTRPAVDLPIETLVVAGASVDLDAIRALGPEHRAVIDACPEPRSVAEVATEVHLPLGAARVVIGDLAAKGWLVVHEPPDRDDVDLIIRLIEGVRAL